MWKTVVHGSHIHETTAGIVDDKWRTLAAAEEEQSCLRFLGVAGNFLVAIVTIEDLPAACRLLIEIVDNIHRLFSTDIAVPYIYSRCGQCLECHRSRHIAVYGKKQVAKVAEGGIVHYFSYCAICCEMVHIIFSYCRVYCVCIIYCPTVCT